ncbi:MAG: hypothetical protein HY016_12775 [Nitrosomonadales bacterium]|nr:hypothetical protein [Nitrosomonadales bacterium]
MMEQSKPIPMFGLTTLPCLAFAFLAFPSDSIAKTDSVRPPVTVGVYAQHAGGKVVYHYRVSNNTQRNITSVSVGRDNQRDENPNNDVNELIELPAGWNAKLGIPSTSAASPTGWRASVIEPEENEAHAIIWETLNDRSPKLVPGQTISKMSVTLERADSNYMTGHAVIAFSEGYPAELTVPINQLDNTPPSLTVNLHPNTLSLQNSKYVTIKAAFILKDDYDHAPEIKLESITANEPLEADDIRDASIGLDDRYIKFRATSKNPSGRIYTVTYSATDASGNQTTASATVTVTSATPASVVIPMPATSAVMAPHDQSEKKNP